MAGIYLHIPFCKQACFYCDFHFSTNLRGQASLVAALSRELEIQKDYLSGEAIDTIYFGGGTPSMLETSEVMSLLQTIRDSYSLEAHEITLEANPDDLSPAKLEGLKRAGINRLSIGIQSFDDTVLRMLNRAHDSENAVKCIADARAAGFDNISIDLIYAIPGQDLERWKENIVKALALRPEHISSYSLTIEEKTVFGKRAKQGLFHEVGDDDAAAELQTLVTLLTSAGYEHYEVSNFSLPGKRSQHNSSYWRDRKYLGIGPSAHSYNGQSRQFNVSNNKMYVDSIAHNVIPYTQEILSRNDKINEVLLTNLRTSWGVNLAQLSMEFGFDLMKSNGDYIRRLIDNNMASHDGDHLILTEKGRLLADKIASDLFVDE